MKDFLIKQALNRFAIKGVAMSDYGNITSIRVDKLSKTVELTLDLKGESEAINISIGKYELSDGSVSVSSISSSREWLTTLLNSFVANKQFPIENKLILSVMKLLI